MLIMPHRDKPEMSSSLSPYPLPQRRQKRVSCGLPTHAAGQQTHQVPPGRRPKFPTRALYPLTPQLTPPSLEPVLGLGGGHAAQVRVSALHFARLPLGHLLGDVIGVGVL